MRHFIVDAKAFLLNPNCLHEGIKLWEEVKSRRENFLLLPSQEYTGFSSKGAEPQDRAALTRGLLEILVKEISGSDKLKPIAMKTFITYWTEHSSRSTVPTWARCMGVSGEQVDRLGWWCTSKAASDEYVRSFRELAAGVQASTAGKCRAILDGHVQDYIGEARLVATLIEKLQIAGVEEGPMQKIQKLFRDKLREGSSTPSMVDTNKLSSGAPGGDQGGRRPGPW